LLNVSELTEVAPDTPTVILALIAVLLKYASLALPAATEDAVFPAASGDQSAAVLQTWLAALLFQYNGVVGTAALALNPPTSIIPPKDAAAVTLARFILSPSPR